MFSLHDLLAPQNAVLVVGVVVAVWLVISPAFAQDNGCGVIKGRVVWDQGLPRAPRPGRSSLV